MIQFERKNVENSLETLRAIAHPLRLALVEFIDKKGIVNVNKIYSTLKLEQSVTSQHLRILRNADLLNTKREGKFVFYMINWDKMIQVNNAITNFSKNSVKATKAEKN